MKTSEILKFFADYIKKNIGIIFDEQNFFQLQNRLESISHLLALEPSATVAHEPQQGSELQALYDYALAQGISGPFKQLLLDVATNNETSFFRDPKVFQQIEQLVQSWLLLQPQVPLLGGKPTFEIWSAAASSGQEALSLAMLGRELQGKGSLPFDLEILGTDVSERMLERARAARYSQLEVQRGLSAARLIRYFSKDEGPLPGVGGGGGVGGGMDEKSETWVAKSELINCLTFQKLNLLDEFGFVGKFDLILCRNVLIYQNVPGKMAILEKLVRALKPGGFLILGSGESLIGLVSGGDGSPSGVRELRSEVRDGAVIYYKGARAA